MSEDQSVDKIVVEEGVSSDLQARIEKFAEQDLKQAEGMPNIEIVPNPDNPTPEEQSEVSFGVAETKESPPKEDTKAEETPSKPEEGSGAEETQGTPAIDGLNEFLSSSKLSEQELLDKLLDSPDAKLSVTIKGKPREITYSDIRSMMGREESFQKKHDLLMKSDEQRLGTLMLAAKNGDKGAQKKVQGLLKDMTGASDGGEIDEKLEDVEDKFDEDKAIQEKTDKAAWDEVFLDVKNDVDYQENLDIVQSDLKARVPSKIYDAYWNNPHTRRTMYDLVALDRVDEILNAFEENLAGMSIEKQLEIESDPEQWGTLFSKTVRMQNASKKQAGATGANPSNTDTGSQPGKSSMDSVSSGDQGRNPAKAQEGTPDFMEMIKKNDGSFQKWKEKHGLPIY